MNALDLFAKRADADSPVTARCAYGCPNSNCREYMHSDPEGNGPPLRYGIEYVGGKLDGRLLVASGYKCGSCGTRRVRLAHTLELIDPNDSKHGRAAIRRVLTNMGVEPRGL